MHVQTYRCGAPMEERLIPTRKGEINK